MKEDGLTNCSQNVGQEASLHQRTGYTRKETTEKVVTYEKLLEGKKFNFDQNISNLILDYDITSDLVLDQKHLCFSSGKYTSSSKGSKIAPIKVLKIRNKLTNFFRLNSCFLPPYMKENRQGFFLV